MLQTIAGAEVKTSQKLGFHHNLRLVVDCWKENWRSLLRGAPPPPLNQPYHHHHHHPHHLHNYHHHPHHHYHFHNISRRCLPMYCMKKINKTIKDVDIAL